MRESRTFCRKMRSRSRNPANRSSAMPILPPISPLLTSPTYMGENRSGCRASAVENFFPSRMSTVSCCRTSSIRRSAECSPMTSMAWRRGSLASSSIARSCVNIATSARLRTPVPCRGAQTDSRSAVTKYPSRRSCARACKSSSASTRPRTRPPRTSRPAYSKVGIGSVHLGRYQPLHLLDGRDTVEDLSHPHLPQHLRPVGPGGVHQLDFGLPLLHEVADGVGQPNDLVHAGPPLVAQPAAFRAPHALVQGHVGIGREPERQEILLSGAILALAGLTQDPHQPLPDHRHQR